MTPFPPDVRRAIDTLRGLQQRAEAGWQPGGFDYHVVAAAADAAVFTLDRYAKTPEQARAFLAAIHEKPAFTATVPKRTRKAAP